MMWPFCKHKGVELAAVSRRAVVPTVFAQIYQSHSFLEKLYRNSRPSLWARVKKKFRPIGELFFPFRLIENMRNRELSLMTEIDVLEDEIERLKNKLKRKGRGGSKNGVQEKR